MSRDSTLRRKYGITVADYEAIREAQQGRCALCGAMPTESMHVDHCHKTGRVRGLLCGHCNKGLGLFRDDPELLRRAIAYLRMTTGEKETAC